MNENYPLYVKWELITDWTLQTAERMPKSLRFTLANRLFNHALDGLECIIDAIYTKNRLPLLKQLNQIIEKLRILFRLCKRRNLISVRQHEFISNELNEAGKMLGGWIKHEKV